MVYQRKQRAYEQEPLQVPQVKNDLFASPDVETEEADTAYVAPGPTAAPNWEAVQRQIDNPVFDFSKISILPPDSALQRQPVDPSTLSKRERFMQRFLSVPREPVVSSMPGPPGPLDHYFAAPREDGLEDCHRMASQPPAFSSLPLFPKEEPVRQEPTIPPVQAKLTVGPAGDRYEQEADHVAAQVVDTINHPHCQPTVQRDKDGEDADRQSRINIWSPRLKTGHTPIQPTRQRVGEAGGGVSDETASQIAQAKGGGQCLDEGLQRSMSQAMGADFSGVRIHTDAQANQLNQTIQAKAFTTGQDVFFKRGAYDPNSKGGQELIAHELTHVVQQGGATLQGNSVVQRRTDEVIQRDDDDWDDDVHPAMKAGVARGKKNLDKHEQLYESVNQQLGQPDNSPDLYDDYNFHKSVRSVNQSIGPVNVTGDAKPVTSTAATKTHTYKTNWHRQYENQDKDKTQDFQTDYSKQKLSLNSKKQPKQKFDHRTFIASRKQRKNYTSGTGNATTKVTEAMKSDELKAYLKRIPIEELGAINEYQGSSYTAMNKNLRSGSGKAQGVKLAASGLNRLPPVVGTVYRGVKLGFDDCEKYGYLNVGGIKTEKAFMSTTIDKRYWYRGFGNGKTAFQIESKGGAKDLRAIAGSGVEGEDELIFTPGTQFKVQGVTPRSEVITSSNVGDIPSRPDVTQPVTAKDLKKQYQAKAVVMYLQEVPSKEQAGMYEELGKKYGTVNINKATEMSKLMQAIESNIYKRENISERSAWSIINWRNFHVHVLSAIKQISKNLDLSDAVINKLKSGSVSGLEEFTQTNPSVKTLLSRWKTYTDMVKKEISDIKEAWRRQEEEERVAYAKILPFLNDDLSIAKHLVKTLEQEGYGSGKESTGKFIRKFLNDEYKIKIKGGPTMKLWRAIKQLKGWS